MNVSFRKARVLNEENIRSVYHAANLCGRPVSNRVDALIGLQPVACHRTAAGYYRPSDF